MPEDKSEARRKHRSPAYPFLNLQDAIDLAQKFYRTEGRHKVPAEIAIKDLGYSPTSGSGLRTLAALISYGLLVEEGSSEERKVGISEMGKGIVMDTRPESSERDLLLQEAALKPKLHLELWERWQLSETELPSDATMRFSLLRDYEFNETAVDSFIREFKETLAFARLGPDFQTKGNVVQSIEESVIEPEAKVVQREWAPLQAPRSDPKVRQLTFPLMGGDVLTLIVPHALTKRDFQKLQQWIELMEDALLYRDIPDFEDQSADEN